MAAIRPIGALALLAAAVALTGCGGGSKMLREPVPMALEAPLAIQTDAQLAAALDWVIVPGGPGSWAKNAYWDEYLVSVESQVPWPVDIVAVSLVDGLAATQAPLPERRQLVAGTKHNVRRFRDAGLEARPGAGVDGLATAGALAGGYGAFAGAQLGMALTSIGVSSGTAVGMAAGGAVVVAAPVLAVGGIVRSVNNSKVNDEILARQSQLPIVLAPNEPRRLHLFMPVTPAPQRLAIDYRIGAVTKTLILDVSTPLGGLHLLATPES